MWTFFYMALSLLLLTTFACNAPAQERRLDDLTANDLAEALGVHWWIVKVPHPQSPKDSIKVELVSADGKVLPGGGALGGQFDWGGEVRVYCYEELALHQLKVMLKTKDATEGGYYFDDYFKSASASGGVANGTVVSVADVFMKFNVTKAGTLTGGTVLGPGEIGLRVVIKHMP